MKDLHGKIVFVTGGSGGIGEGIARAFAELGARVAIADIDEARGMAVTEALNHQSGDAAFIPLDVTDRTAWRRALDIVETRWGLVDILCNNAGASALGMPISALSPSTWDRSVQLNLTSVYNGVAAVVEDMCSRGSGHIVNTASIAGLMADIPNATAYTATKFGVVGLSETLAVELAPHGVGVTVVCPGAVRTSLWKSSRSALGLPPHSPRESVNSPSASPDAMDPLLLGRLIAKAVQESQFYVITHPEYDAKVEERYRAIRQGALWTRDALNATTTEINR
ncbi:SDR family oxidoreductase [Burkholderia sp. Bp9142]|uniref:SDR family oxidoreductase n=1 Tax=Burkholderia sp. Bp9142 TaxID=2184573 RepID=UPI001627B824|nr:SDR family oxidoreductase [Burkholderia sp. Bp9142]